MTFLVVIPVYNRVGSLRRAVESVIAQTHEDWRCLIVDDGSDDGTLDLIVELEHLDDRVEAISYRQHRGGVYANEIGLRSMVESSHEAWSRLGSDDYWLPHKLELDAWALGEQPNAGVVWGPWRIMHLGHDVREMYGLPMDARGALLSGGFAASWVNVAARREALQDVYARFGFGPPELQNMDDWIVNSRLARVCEFAWRGVYEHGVRMTGAQVFEGSQEALLYDAAWSVSADGASNDAATCAEDARVTRRLISEDDLSYLSAPRLQLPVIVGRHELR